MLRGAAAILMFAACAAVATARDPGNIETRGRDAGAPRNSGVTDRPLLPSDIGGPWPPLRSRDARPLYEQVERDIDRGTGRIEDEQTYQLRRLQTDRDERIGRI